MNAEVLLLPGDGIGPEVIAAAKHVVEQIASRFGHTFTWRTEAIGGAAIRQTGVPLPARTLSAAKNASAVLLGAVGGPEFSSRAPAERPEAALLSLRRELGLFANLRPARVWPGLENAGPLKPGVLARTDLIIVRELTGGLYYGEPRGVEADGAAAFNTMRYSRAEIARVARIAYSLARKRRRRLVSVDKANVLEVSALWRATVNDVAREFPDVTVSHEYVDAAAMKLALAPASVDVVLTENMFGDILSDEAGAICGSIGLLPSASIGGAVALFEPVHGSAPDLAGHDVANPVGALASAAMLLAEGLQLHEEARCLTRAIEDVLALGLRTRDIAGASGPWVGTRAFTRAVADALEPALTRP